MISSSETHLASRCHFRADDVLCADGFLYYSKAVTVKVSDEEGRFVSVGYKPVSLEDERVTCPACEGRGMILTERGKEMLIFLEVFAKPALRDLVAELFEERQH
jgi:predicted methyltransferase